MVQKADFWVFVLNGFKRHSFDFVVVPKAELKSRLRLIHGFEKKIIQSYLWVTERNRCWETRDLDAGKKDRRRIKDCEYENPVWDFTKFLNEEGWAGLAVKLIQKAANEVSQAEGAAVSGPATET